MVALAWAVSAFVTRAIVSFWTAIHLVRVFRARGGEGLAVWHRNRKPVSVLDAARHAFVHLALGVRYPRGVRLLGLSYLARLRLVAEVPVALDPLPSVRASRHYFGVAPTSLPPL